MPTEVKTNPEELEQKVAAFDKVENNLQYGIYFITTGVDYGKNL